MKYIRNPSSGWMRYVDKSKEYESTSARYNAELYVLYLFAVAHAVSDVPVKVPPIYSSKAQYLNVNCGETDEEDIFASNPASKQLRQNCPTP